MKKLIFIVVLLVLIVGGWWYTRQSRLNEVRAIETYADCVAAGYQILNYPPRCLTPDGRTLVDESATSEAPTGLTTLPNGAYTVDNARTTIFWEGRKTLLPEWVDRGTIVLNSGRWEIADGQLATMELEFDMNSITAVSTGRGSGESDLATHLKSNDFFGVEEFPTARFVLTSASPDTVAGAYLLRGDLTIRDTTKPIEFPVTLSTEGDDLAITGEATVNRAEYNVRFGSGSFFQNLGNNVIDDNFRLIFTVYGSPADALPLE